MINVEILPGGESRGSQLAPSLDDGVGGGWTEAGDPPQNVHRGAVQIDPHEAHTFNHHLCTIKIVKTQEKTNKKQTDADAMYVTSTIN